MHLVSLNLLFAGSIFSLLPENPQWHKDTNDNLVLGSNADTKTPQLIFFYAEDSDTGIGNFGIDSETDPWTLYVSDELTPKGQQKRLKFKKYDRIVENVDVPVEAQFKAYNMKYKQPGDNEITVVGYYVFESVAFPGLVIDVEASKTAEGTPLIVYKRHDGDNQVFKLEDHLA